MIQNTGLVLNNLPSLINSTAQTAELYIIETYTNLNVNLNLVSQVGKKQKSGSKCSTFLTLN